MNRLIMTVNLVWRVVPRALFFVGAALSGLAHSNGQIGISDYGTVKGFVFDNGATSTTGYYSTRDSDFDSFVTVPRSMALSSSSPEMQALRFSELQLDYSLRNAQIHLANVKSEAGNLLQMGFSRDSFRFDAFGGNGETVSGLRSRYSGVDPFLFHGGVEQNYQYTGVAMGYQMGKSGTLNLAQATISSRGLEDRSVKRLGYTRGALEMSYTLVRRGAVSVGSAYAISAGLGKFRFGYDYLSHGNGSRFQSATLTTRLKGIRYSASLQSAKNPLYSRKNENRLMFSLGFSTRGGSRWLHNAESSAEAQQGGSGESDQKDGVNGNKYLIGGALVGAGLAISSGSSSSDNAQRFTGQNGAAYDVLNRINPKSVAENREYGGYIYRNSDGSFSSTAPVKGTPNSVLLPPIASVIPGSSRARASYHTHAGPDPRYDNENFSPVDILADIRFGLDGYLGTPGGRFRFHDLSAGTITTLGTIAN